MVQNALMRVGVRASLCEEAVRYRYWDDDEPNPFDPNPKGNRYLCPPDTAIMF